ncbi:MAG: 4Fe-4S dicluster domain-containing protein [Anaerolineales bacterium]
MTHIITSLCLRDGGCVDVCPVECIVPGMPQDKYPWYYIDPVTCIDCGACIPECPYEAIFTEDETPEAYAAKGGEYQAMPVGTPGFEETFEGSNHYGNPVKMGGTRTLQAGETLNLRPDIQPNYDYFTSGPGYWEGWQQHGR